MLNLIKTYDRTCSAFLPEENSLTFAKNERLITLAKRSNLNLVVLISEDLRAEEGLEGKCLLLPRTNYLKDFIHYHNIVNKNREHRQDIICTKDIHPTASIGNIGMRYEVVFNEFVGMKHMGAVVLSDGVTIGPFSSVARATLDYTIIGKDTKIGCGVHIGHNVQIGERNIITDGTVIGGSAMIDDNCFIGLNSTIRNGISICSKVLIGMGSVVVNHITTPGIYAGNPAKYMKEWDGKW